jgi:hypothetical protein
VSPIEELDGLKFDHGMTQSTVNLGTIVRLVLPKRPVHMKDGDWVLNVTPDRESEVVLLHSSFEF